MVWGVSERAHTPLIRTHCENMNMSIYFPNKHLQIYLKVALAFFSWWRTTFFFCLSHLSVLLRFVYTFDVILFARLFASNVISIHIYAWTRAFRLKSKRHTTWQNEKLKSFIIFLLHSKVRVCVFMSFCEFRVVCSPFFYMFANFIFICGLILRQNSRPNCSTTNKTSNT